MSLNRQVLFSGPVDYIVVGTLGLLFYYTIEGFTLSLETNWVEIETDQVPGITKRVKNYQKLILEFTVPEMDYRGALLAFAQPDSNYVISPTHYVTVSNALRTRDQVEIHLPVSNTNPGRIIQIDISKVDWMGATQVEFGKGKQTGWKIRGESNWDDTCGWASIAFHA